MEATHASYGHKHASYVSNHANHALEHTAADVVKASFPTLKVGKEAFTERDQAPAADFRSAARAVLSHGRDSSGRPKWPYAAVGA